MKYALSFIGGVLMALLVMVLIGPRQGSWDGHDMTTTQTDTTIRRDTVKDVPGEAKRTEERTVGTAEVRVAKSQIKSGDTAQPPIRADTGVAESDTVSVTLPLVQSVYESEDYRAYVSGAMARLDSIFVFPTHETVTVKEKTAAKRWHIGVTGGYGVTAKGLQPYVGVGLTYSLISF